MVELTPIQIEKFMSKIIKTRRAYQKKKFVNVIGDKK